MARFTIEFAESVSGQILALTRAERVRVLVLDQMRAVDTARLVRRLGRIDRRTGGVVLAMLQEMFAP